MATVFANRRAALATNRLATMLLSGLLLSGCSVLLETTDKSSPAAGENQQPRQQQMADAKSAPLPRQDYDSQGNKLPYRAQPNPYTSGAAAVPTEAKALFIAADQRLQRGDVKGARAAFKQLTARFPQLSGPWLKLGDIEQARDNADKAMAHYRKAIEINADNVNAYIALGLLQRKQGQFAAAQNTYLDALRVWKDFPEAHLNLAVLYDLYVNQPEAAQQHFEAYHFLTGAKDARVHKWLVEVKRRTGIDKSFIDNSPAVVVENNAETAAEAVAQADGSDQQVQDGNSEAASL